MSVFGVVCMILGVASIITLLLEIILHGINKIFNRKLDLPIEKCEKPTPLGVGWIA